MASAKDFRTKPLSSMNLTELKKFVKDVQGAGIKGSGDVNKAINLIKVMQPERYGKSTVESAKKSLTVNTEIPNLQRLGITDIPDWKVAEQQAKDYDRQIKAGTTPTATSGMSGMSAGGDLTSQLSSYQDGVFSQATSPQLREQIAAQLEPQGIAKPEPLNRVALYDQMREQYGVTGLETTVTDLKAQIENQYAQRRQRSQTAEGAPVAMGVIAGRVGEIERQENERIDALTRQLNTYNDQLNTAYNMISTYMNYAGLDYQDAVNAYNTEYNRNLQIYNLVDEEMDEQTAQARANLQIYLNAIEKGNISYNSLPASQKSLITKLEVQAGLPAGFTSSLKATDAGGKVLSTTTREVGGQKYVDVVLQMPDGSMKVKSQALGAVSGGSTKVNEQQIAEATSRVFEEKNPNGTYKWLGNDQSKPNDYRKISPSDWNQLSAKYVSQTGNTEEDFAKRFGQYVNKSYKTWWQDYSGFENPNK